MYFDAVFHKNNVLVFNGSPEETVAYLNTLSLDQRERCYVIPGESLKQVTVQRYLDVHNS